ncbi:TonB-dependent receptor [Spirosoma rhododendri]|uniref:TonB-dependent receptor n=1 Tax=Spirosoma rhododendri TaxID=2728024 RepID=A0A7L5DNC4_9BACT|nr:TonB-dependent receptor [Spirosoma rhododendri]QJD79984.1 TonB-dependent receptor [Spirosoma rhododendri]
MKTNVLLLALSLTLGVPAVRATPVPSFYRAEQTVTGLVQDNAGSPIAGANVLLKGSTKGSQTDAKGQFSITVPDAKAVLVFSFVGYAPQEIAVGNRSVINVTMVAVNKSLDEVVVTGVFDPRTRLETSTSVSILKTKDVERMAATSAADYLKNVPGVFVNAGRGEIANQLTTRGLTLYPNAYSYNYVSMQEDGLPVTNINYATDYYIRPDATTARIEVLRGGSAAVTGPNAPGGIFNYISKTGGEVMGGEVRAKVGLEGDGRNPYYRADFDLGGPLNKDKSLRFNLGGFYRYANGARYPGYPANNGGQVKLNLTKTYKNGTIKLYGKFLDDRNLQYSFMPTQGWAEQALPAGFNYTDSYDMPSIQMQLPRNGQTVDFDSRNKYHSTEQSIGLNWMHELGNGFSLALNTKYSNKDMLQQGSQIVSPFIPTTNIFYILPGLAGRFGTYTFTDLATGQQLGTFTRLPGQPIVAGDKNNFPGVNNQVLFMPAFMTRRAAKESMSQASVSKQLKTMRFTAGMYYGTTTQTSDGQGTGSGPGAATIQDRPHMIGISLAATDGKTYQVTNPQGFMKLDEGGQNTSYVDQTVTSVFFGHDWQIIPKLNFDWGLRYEMVSNRGWNATTIPTNTADAVTFGGFDNNPLTLYDNFGGVPATPINYNIQSRYMSYSFGLNYRLGESQSVYARVSRGGKSPDVNTLYTLTSQFLVDNNTGNTLLQNVDQYEFGYKYTSERFKLFVTPFVSRLTNVITVNNFRNVDNTSYVPPLQHNSFITKGVEIEGDVALTKRISVRASALFQNSVADQYKTWVANANGPQDDVLLDFSGNKTGGVPPVMYSLSPRYTTNKFFAILNFNYVSDRPANTPNGFMMKGYSNTDVSMGYQVSSKLGLQLNVNNLFSQYGLLEWLGSGGFPANLNRDRITPDYVKANPNDVFSGLRNMPRAYYLTATYRF